MEYNDIVNWLFSKNRSSGIQLGLERMEGACKILGNPERAFRCVHVAGTNGKGSVSAMVESILRASGCRTGLYTSPHLVRLGERVQVNRSPLSEEEIVAYVAPDAGVTLDVPALAAWARERLSDFKVPGVIHVRESLPHTATARIASRTPGMNETRS